MDSASTVAREGYLRGAEGQQLWFSTAGAAGDTVVVVHGFQGHSSAYLAPDLGPLAQGRTLLVYDQRGAGRSALGPGQEQPGLDDHVDDLDALRIQLGLDRLHLFAHSGGAAIALAYAGRHPERVGRVLLVAPPPLVGEGYGEQAGRSFYARLDSASWDYARQLDAQLASADSPKDVCRALTALILPRAFFADPSAYGRMKGNFCSGSEETLRTLVARREAFLHSLASRSWDAILSRIASEVLVIHGSEDAIPSASARTLAGSLPNARVLVVSGADHLPWLEQPGVFFPAADSFLRGEWPTGSERMH